MDRRRRRPRSLARSSRNFLHPRDKATLSRIARFIDSDGAFLAVDRGRHESGLPNYRIKDPVVSDGYTDRSTVDSDSGTFEVQGDGALRKLLTEIWAIGELKKLKKSEAFAKGIDGAAKAPIGFAKSLITHPVDTVTGVPKGAYAIVENVATSATTTKDPSEDAKLAQALNVSSFKREYAARLDVDPYSSNKVLQKELNSAAWAATIGDWAFSAAMLPAGSAGSVVSNLRLTNSVKNAVKEEPPARLRIINDDKLARIGIAEDLRTRFLLALAQTKSGALLIALPLDRLIWSDRVDQVSRDVKAAYKGTGWNGKLELWLTGTASARAKDELTRRGYALAESAGTRVEILD